MATPRLTKEQVHGAAAELDREGKKPTAANVRDRIGSGSFTTILKFLTDYEGPDASDGPDTIPEAPVAAIAAVWAAAYTAAWKQFDEQLRKVSETADRHLDAIADLEGLTADLEQRLNMTGRDMEKALRDLQDSRDRYERDVTRLKSELATSAARLDEAQKERDRLFATVQRSLALDEPAGTKKMNRNDKGKVTLTVTPESDGTMTIGEDESGAPILTASISEEEKAEARRVLEEEKARLYVDPLDDTNTWDGRGKLPAWVRLGMRAANLDPSSADHRITYKMGLPRR